MRGAQLKEIDLNKSEELRLLSNVKIKNILAKAFKYKGTYIVAILCKIDLEKIGIKNEEVLTLSDCVNFSYPGCGNNLLEALMNAINNFKFYHRKHRHSPSR
jgi:hypothetical protein